MSDVIIFGLRDFAELLYESIKINALKVSQNPVGFVVDDEYYEQERFCDEHVYRYSELKKTFSCNEVEILIAIGYRNMNQHREKIFRRLLQDGWEIASYIDPDSIVRTKSFGRGNIVFDAVNIGIGCQVGDGNVFYPGAFLAHHCTIGNFNFFAPRVSIAGRVQIGDACFFGNNSCTKDHIQIANQTLVGAGCYIDSSIASSGGVYVSSRCIKMSRNSKDINF